MKNAAAVIALAAAAAVPASLGAAPPAPLEADLVIRGGTIYPGEAAPFRGDVAIKGDRIVYVGPQAPGTAARVIDAAG